MFIQETTYDKDNRVIHINSLREAIMVDDLSVYYYFNIPRRFREIDIRQYGSKLSHANVAICRNTISMLNDFQSELFSSEASAYLGLEVYLKENNHVYEYKLSYQ